MQFVNRAASAVVVSELLCSVVCVCAYAACDLDDASDANDDDTHTRVTL